MSTPLNMIINSTYQSLGKVKKGYKPRSGQQSMSSTIAEVLDSETINTCVIEGQTGSGKSLGYLISAISAIQDKGCSKKVVVATANVALQQQLIENELPTLKQSGLNFTEVLAAGRGRYFCLSKAHEKIEDEKTPIKSAQLMEELLYRYEQNDWDGLKDSLADDNPNIESTWDHINAKHTKCDDCPFRSKCCFVNERAKIADANVIVANHALVWSDLENNNILPAPEDSIYVFDEAHHVPKSYRDSLQQELNLTSFADKFGRYGETTAKEISSITKEVKTLTSLESKECLTECKAIFETIKPLTDHFKQSIIELAKQDTLVQRLLYTDYGVPRDIYQHIDSNIIPKLDGLEKILEKASEWFRKEKELSGWQEELRSKCNTLLGRTKSAISAFQLFSQVSTVQEPLAQWIENTEDKKIKLKLCASYVRIGNMMQENLYNRAYKVVFASATLQTLGNFERYNVQMGLDKNKTKYLCIESPFNYQDNAKLHLVSDIPTPNYSDETLHLNAIAKRITSDFKAHQSGVLLFASKKQLFSFIELLDDNLLDIAKLQYTDSRNNLIKEHIKAIDNNERSLLIGCQSLSEGLDLPREYLTYVGITKIPFANISEPLELAESAYCKKQKKNPFFEISLPDACAKLIQSTGRLIRTTDCSGELFIYDPRLVQKNYGKTLVNALPNYDKHAA